MEEKINSEKIRQEFLNFFLQRGHQLVASHPLVSPDRSVLLTTAGMQPFKPCFLGEGCPYSPRVVSCQKCFRTSDIKEVGDDYHLTFFEMLGNFSFGDYSRQEAVHWALELLVNGYHLDKEKLAFTFFEGDEEVPTDQETKKIILEEGILQKSIIALGREDNFWGPVGKSGPCGPTMEIYYEMSAEHHSPRSENDLNQRFVEIWNLVFDQYFQNEQGQLSALPKLGIDTGLGLERLTMILEKKSSVFETDLLAGLLKLVHEKGKTNFPNYSCSSRIVVDHLRGLVFLAADGIRPSNLGRGYVLRSIIRRLIENGAKLGLGPEDWPGLIQWLLEKYSPIYPLLKGQEKLIATLINQEEGRLKKAFQKGWKELEKLGKKSLSGEDVFRLYTTYGLSSEEIKKAGYQFQSTEFQQAVKKHQKVSRQGQAKKFGGHGIVDAEQEKNKVRLHTATHLLQAALRDILGSDIRQQGSDINNERLRFDFSFVRALTPGEIKSVEKWVNQRIKNNLKIRKEILNLEQAKRSSLFLEKAKYPNTVSVYTIFNPASKKIFSKEICAGPHVSHLSELGSFRIIQESSCAAGIRRIKAILD